MWFLYSPYSLYSWCILDTQMKIRGKNSGFGEINMKVKTRQQGNSVVLTVPKTLNVPVDAEFSVDLKKNGDLVYKRVRDNGYDLWSDPSYDYETEIKREYKELGYNPRELEPKGKERI